MKQEDIARVRLSDEEMGEVQFDMGSPWGVSDRYTVGRAIADAQTCHLRDDLDWGPKEEIEKAERERMIKSLRLLNEKGFNLGSAISAIEESIEEQALKGETK